MPEKLLDQITNDEVRDLFAYLCGDDPKSAPPPPKVSQGKKLRVALISGSLEYKSDETLPVLQKYLESTGAIECVRMFRKSDTDISGLDGLASCDVAVFYTRRLKPESAQLELVKKYINSGKPVVGLRTASHGFQNWLEMDRLVFGGDYKGHFGSGPKCAVKITAKGHAVLDGVSEFTSVGSLYKNPGVAKDATVLLSGTIDGGSEPVAWVRERTVDGAVQRVFYTSLGHPEDFRDSNFLRLVANGLLWSARRQAR
jgi:type 1 glutamine amidotransferase